ncbi:RNA-directed DNA polymerase, eukaryota, reverse transcriptase zinc-binding domain protein [Tanacetum coccineum]
MQKDLQKNSQDHKVPRLKTSQEVKPYGNMYNCANGPKRCALKIDLQKAYDTVNWSFIEESLASFGFPNKMIRWIMACITSSKFTICVNVESLDDETKGEIQNILPFKIGKLPVKYLGVPLMSKKIRVADCNVLIDKVTQKLSD